jgi:hypothetical protein
LGFIGVDIKMGRYSDKATVPAHLSLLLEVKRMNEARIKEIDKLQTELLAKYTPKFERGIAEASLDKEQDVRNELFEVLKKHHIVPSVSLKLDSECQARGNEMQLICGGVLVTMQYRVMPSDRQGKSGKMSEEDEDVYLKLNMERKNLIAQTEGMENESK